jgi:general stress protein YciG
MDKAGSSKGGKETVARHGKQHMAEIGKRGFATTVARHWGGDAKSYVEYLHQRSHDSQIEALTDIQLRSELAKGKDIACAELPVLEDYEPVSWRDKVKSSKEESMVDLPW